MNRKIIIALIIIFIILGGFFISKKFEPVKDTNTPSNTQTSSNVSEKDKPQIVATKPEPLEEAIISATEVIEITFNRPLENIGEFKVRLEPEDVKYKLELSSDRKTGKIIPEKPYELGASFTLFIGPETKFDGVGRWGEEKIFHFKTIRYRGI